MFPASRPSRGVVSCVALGLSGHPPKGVVPRYPPRGVLRDWSRPVPGSCRGVVSPLTGGFPHNRVETSQRSQRVSLLSAPLHVQPQPRRRSVRRVRRCVTVQPTMDPRRGCTRVDRIPVRAQESNRAQHVRDRGCKRIQAKRVLEI